MDENVAAAEWFPLDALPESPNFGVQYDPSNAVVGGDEPEPLRVVEPLHLSRCHTVSFHISRVSAALDPRGVKDSG